MVRWTAHHGRFGAGDDDVRPCQHDFRIDEHATALATDFTSATGQWPLDGHGPDEFHLQCAGDDELTTQNQRVADHLVENTCGPSTMRDVGSALVVARAFDLTDDDAVVLQSFAMQTQTAFGQSLARSAQHHAGG